MYPCGVESSALIQSRRDQSKPLKWDGHSYSDLFNFSSASEKSGPEPHVEKVIWREPAVGTQPGVVLAAMNLRFHFRRTAVSAVGKFVRGGYCCTFERRLQRLERDLNLRNNASNSGLKEKKIGPRPREWKRANDRQISSRTGASSERPLAQAQNTSRWNSKRLSNAAEWTAQIANAAAENSIVQD